MAEEVQLDCEINNEDENVLSNIANDLDFESDFKLDFQSKKGIEEKIEYLTSLNDKLDTFNKRLIGNIDNPECKENKRRFKRYPDYYENLCHPYFFTEDRIQKRINWLFLEQYVPGVFIPKRYTSTEVRKKENGIFYNSSVTSVIGVRIKADKEIPKKEYFEEQLDTIKRLVEEQSRKIKILGILWETVFDYSNTLSSQDDYIFNQAFISELTRLWTNTIHIKRYKSLLLDRCSFLENGLKSVKHAVYRNISFDPQSTEPVWVQIFKLAGIIVDSTEIGMYQLTIEQVKLSYIHQEYRHYVLMDLKEFCSRLFQKPNKMGKTKQVNYDSVLSGEVKNGAETEIKLLDICAEKIVNELYSK
ncbi:MAG: hypothetical protein PF447_08200 [Spirochaetaceae bacterium]|nr:hypothetical protein [Spirochaetaceae bacterium]